MNDDNDDVIQPDAVSGPSSGSETDGKFGPEDLAETAVGLVLGLLRRANALAGGVLIFAVVACVGGYLLGIAALSGGVRSFWIIVGGILAVWAIGSVLISMWRLHAVRKGSDLLVDEVLSFLSRDSESERTIIDTVEFTQGSDDDGIVTVTRQFSGLRAAVKNHTADFAQLSMAMSSITTFPGVMALATLIGLGFAGLSLIFGLILIF
ncbi:MAG: hypothetical protein ACJAR2_001416 [Ilumatobacter sp.]|jgi:hypothetical protein